MADVGKFYGIFWYILLTFGIFMAIWYINGHLVYFVVIWYIFSSVSKTDLPPPPLD
jgi:hypothetical protein